MADTVGYFQILNPDQQDWDGQYAAKDANELRNGILCKITSAGKLDQCGAGDVPSGFAYTNRTLVYSPTTVYAAADEPVTLVRGAIVRFMADIYSFSAGALPAVGDLLYTGASGLIAINTGAATAYIGKCISAGLDTIRAAPNTTLDVVECEAKFLI